MKHCAFVLQIQEPEETMKKLLLFFIDRHIVIDHLLMNRHPTRTATLIIHCQVEKDRVPRTVQLMEKLQGIIEMEVLR